MKVRKEKLINRLKLIIDSNWLKIINESKGIDKVKWTNRFNKLIKLIKSNEVDKIDLNWLLKFKKIIKVIKKTKETKPITIDVITKKVKKYVNRLINWNWKELIKNVDEKDRENVNNQIELILKLVKENRFNEIDENQLNKIRVTFRKIKKIREDKLPKIDIKLEKEKIIDKIKPLIKENWMKIIDETVDIDKEKWKNRIKTIIELINNNEIDKIDFVWLKKLKKILKIKTKPNNEKVVIDKSNQLLINLNELKWEELINNIDDKNKPEIINKIKIFIQFVKDKKFEKIDKDLIDYIINVIPRLKQIKEVQVTNEKTKNINLKKITETSDKYIVILNELKWEELIKYIDQSNRQEVVTKIKTFIEYVKNKEYDKIDVDLINWITQIITTLRKVHEVHVTNEKTKTINLKTITETSIKYVEFLNELKWKELIKYIDKKNQEEIVVKIKKFINFVQTKQFENIDVELINSITEIINIFKRIAVEHSKTKISEKILITRKLQITLPSNWIELIKRINGIDQQLWISRIQQLLLLMKSNDYEKIDFQWINELEQIIFSINQESIKMKKEVFLNEKSIGNLKTNINSLKQWNWKSLLIYIDENNRQQIQNDLENIVNLVENGNFEKIEIQYFNWFNQIFDVFNKIHSAIEDGYVYDKPTKTWVKNIVQNQRNQRKKRCLFNIFKGFHRLLPRIQIGIGAGRREGKENFIIDLSHKYLVILKELNWRQLVDSDDEETDRRVVIKKINQFIHLVNTRQYRRISRKFLDWLSQLIIRLQNTKIRLTGSRKTKRIEIAKKVLVNLPSNWKEIIVKLRNIDTKLWIKRIQYLLPIIELQEFDKIDFEWLEELQQIIDSITVESKKTVEKPVVNEVTIKTVKENVNLLKEWKWETFLKYIDEDKREEVQTTINKIITITDSEEFDKLDAQSVDLFNQIFEVFNKMNYAVTNGYVYDEKTKTWVKHVVEVENNQRKKRCILLNLFHGAAKKLIPKINIGIFPGGGNRKPRPIVNQESIEKVKENVILLKEMNWENLLQYIDEDKREAIQTNINKIIYVIENGESDKIDSDSLDWFYQIFEQLNKINYAMKNGYVYDQTTRTWVKNTVEVENQIRKKRCFHGLSRKVNKFFRHRPHGFHNKIHVNRLFHFKKNHKIHHRKILPEYREKCIKHVNWLKKYNWKYLVKFMVDKNKRDTIAKIKYIFSLIKNNNYDNLNPDLINWITNIKQKLLIIKNNRKIDENIDENSKIIIKKSHKFIDKLNELKWLKIIDSVDGIDKKETIKKINLFINLIKNQKYNEIDTDFLNWISEITENIKNTKKKLTETDNNNNNNNNNEEVVKKIQINLPSNWKEIIQNIEGIDVNLWIARIENLLTLVQNKEYQKIDFDWIDELQNIVKLITQQSNKTEEKTVISETTITTIKENVNLLKQWNWESLVKYIDEKNRQDVETDVTKMITIVENGEFTKLDSQFVNWFSQIFELFNKINYAMTNGYVYDEKTKTWVKTVTEEENKSRKRRSANFDDIALAKINIDLINQSIEQLQNALSYNLMIIRKNNNQINREIFTKDDQNQLCPFIKKIDEQLITKLTSCSLKQNFICKRQIN